MKVVFFAANCSYSHTSLAAWSLRAMVDETIFEWQTLEITVKDSPSKVLAQLLEAKPDVVAATLYLFNHDFVAGILRSLRALRADCRIVVGGPECLGCNDMVAGTGGLADVAIRGEGERALPALLECWRTGQSWDDLPGFCGLDSQGTFRDNGSAQMIEDFDSLPAFYARELVEFHKPFIQLETSRGCGNGCLFCTSRHTARRVHSANRVRGDLQAIAAAGVKDVRIVDRTFNEDRARALMLVRMFRDEFPMLRFHLEIEPARFNQELAGEFAMAAPGRFHLEAGIQSLNPTVCATIERGATVQRTREGLKRLCDLHNLEVHVDLIAGLPGGELSDILADLEAVMLFRPAEIQLERLKLLPGTPLAQEPSRWGLISKATPPYQVLRTSSLSSDDLQQSDRLSKLIDWFYNTRELHSFIADAAMIDSAFLVRFEEWGREKMGFDVRPSLESRFETLNTFLKKEIGQNGAWESIADRLCYRWFRLGYSPRNRLRPAAPWKFEVPIGAVLVEGDASAKVARKWLVELKPPHLFCYGTGSRGERAVVAVYRL
ncbi:MAG: DUF4080 domain-containing protein [bacterium]